MKNPWAAPIRPVRSIRFDNVVGKKLSDRKIKKYEKAGFYGKERQEEANKKKKSKLVELMEQEGIE